jgi:hypothetical protein
MPLITYSITTVTTKVIASFKPYILIEEKLNGQSHT